MKWFQLAVILFSIISLNVLAGEPVRLGITGEVGADVFFSPTVTHFIIKKVAPNSPADKAGIVEGQKMKMVVK